LIINISSFANFLNVPLRLLPQQLKMTLIEKLNLIKIVFIPLTKMTKNAANENDTKIGAN